MVVLKNKKELQDMREACRLSNAALWSVEPFLQAGVTTKELDHVIHKFIVQSGGKPSFLGYNGFPASACISVNDQVIHGIPSSRVKLKDGDIVKVDVGVIYNGFHGDNAWTFGIGEISGEAKRLLRVTEECLYYAIAQALPGNRIGDISFEVQEHAEANGFGVVREYVGHGVGKHLHEDPEVPNFGNPGRGVRLVPGMTLAIEPMINGVGAGVRQLSDGWTVVTQSGSLSAHFEHTVAITEDGPQILTIREPGARGCVAPEAVKEPD